MTSRPAAGGTGAFDPRVQFPPASFEGNAGRKLPHTFLAGGKVKAQVTTPAGVTRVCRVGGKVRWVPGTGAPTGEVAGKLLGTHLAKGGLLEWVMAFTGVSPGGADRQADLVVDVFGKAVGGAEHAVATATRAGLWVRGAVAEAAPVIDWPDTCPYTLTNDELDLFLTFGSSLVALTGVTLGTALPGLGEWDPLTNLWYALFSPGTDPGPPGPYTLTVSNADGQTDCEIRFP